MPVVRTATAGIQARADRAVSARLTPSAVLFQQRLLSCAGFSPGKLDGVWGAKTDAAQRAWDEEFDLIHSEISPTLHVRSETLIHTLLPPAQRAARTLVRMLRREGLDARIISGTRTYAEQSAIFRQGRYGNPGRVVTYAREGQSNHNFGIAFDIGIFDASGKYLDGDTPTELVPYERAGEISRGVVGLEWGGDWPGKKRDLPHYQLAVKWGLKEVRARFERGEVFT